MTSHGPGRGRKTICYAAGCIVVLLLGLGVIYETRTSVLQSLLLSRLALELRHDPAPGPSDDIKLAEFGPFDERLGFSLIPHITEVLNERRFTISSQARWSPWLRRIVKLGCYPVYRQKAQAGLSLLDRNNAPLYVTAYPQKIYEDFDSIPPLVVATLCFVENRELLESEDPYRNPAIEWDRLLRAVGEQVLSEVELYDRESGGSTIATQLEKFEHTPGGFTHSARDKARQMATASVRAYLDGRETVGARRKIILDYVNSVPLAAVPQYGEVIGLGDGLWAWFEVDFDRFNRLLRTPDAAEATDRARAEAYKQALALIVAHRRPSAYLIANREMLAKETDTYLRLLADEGYISTGLRDAALRIPLTFRLAPAPFKRPSYIDQKAANAVRTQLLDLLDLDQLYALDRIDLTAVTTLDGPAERRISRILERLRLPRVVDSLALRGEHLLARGDPSDIVYSFTLYEATQTGNLLRVQADNYDQPLDINLGAKLDLGSTAKLRTLTNYLEIIADLHRRHAGRSHSDILVARDDAEDPIRRWALTYLSTARDTTLPAMLEASMARTYSASPGEGFFTGGGLHYFSNFNEEDNSRVLTIREGFRNSVNLIFIRLMRDVVRYYQQELPGFDPLMLEDTDDPRRAEYLARYADKEGRQFLAQFYQRYAKKSPREAFDLLTSRVRASARRLATLYRSVYPDAGPDSLAAFLATHLSPGALAEVNVRELYDTYNTETFDLQDRAYILRVDPMELWLVGYLQTNTHPSWSEAAAASETARQEAYRWLFASSSREKQNKRIRIMVEEEAFDLIHQAWQRLGYPFDVFVPSYASAIGSSADRPAALAELVGIIVNNGLRLPTRRLETLHFARGTPFETSFEYTPPPPERVLPQAVARALRGALLEVVENGTARRAYKAFRRPDGSVIEVGGKTGTGDHRFETFGRGGRLIESRVVSRTATFVFFIDERFFGVITALVSGEEAARYEFTSSLPVTIFASLEPVLKKMVLAPAPLEQTTPPEVESEERVLEVADAR